MRLKDEDFKIVYNLFDKSGLSVTAFCNSHGISKTRFYNYRKKLSKYSEYELNSTNKFEAISISNDDSSGNSKPVNAIIYFPNNIRCELEVINLEQRSSLLLELASL
jgi:hypothetical protein